MVVIEEMVDENLVQEQPKASQLHTGLCAYCGSASSSWCPLCHDVFYCSPGCQKVDWKSHKRSCSREFQPKAAVPNNIENPCIRCGKEGRHNSSGNWFCSHDCLGDNLSDLSARVAHAANAKPESIKHAAQESNRIADLIKSAGKTSDSPTRQSQQTQNERLLDLIKSSEKKAEQKSSAPDKRLEEMIRASERPTEEAQDNRLKDLISKSEWQAEDRTKAPDKRLEEVIRASERPTEEAQDNRLKDLILKSEWQAEERTKARNAQLVAQEERLRRLIAAAERNELASMD